MAMTQADIDEQNRLAQGFFKRQYDPVAQGAFWQPAMSSMAGAAASDPAYAKRITDPQSNVYNEAATFLFQNPGKTMADYYAGPGSKLVQKPAAGGSAPPAWQGPGGLTYYNPNGGLYQGEDQSFWQKDGSWYRGAKGGAVTPVDKPPFTPGAASPASPIVQKFLDARGIPNAGGATPPPPAPPAGEGYMPPVQRPDTGPGMLPIPQNVAGGEDLTGRTGGTGREIAGVPPAVPSVSTGPAPSRPAPAAGAGSDQVPAAYYDATGKPYAGTGDSFWFNQNERKWYQGKPDGTVTPVGLAPPWENRTGRDVPGGNGATPPGTGEGGQLTLQDLLGLLTGGGGASGGGGGAGVLSLMSLLGSMGNRPKSWNTPGVGYGSQSRQNYWNEAGRPFRTGEDTKSYWYNKQDQKWYQGELSGAVSQTDVQPWRQLPWLEQPWKTPTGDGSSVVYLNAKGGPFKAGDTESYWYNRADQTWYKGDLQGNVTPAYKLPWM